MIGYYRVGSNVKIEDATRVVIGFDKKPIPYFNDDFIFINKEYQSTVALPISVLTIDDIDLLEWFLDKNIKVD